MELKEQTKIDIGRYASIGSMGSIIVLLLHNVQVLDQHGEELNHVRVGSAHISHQVEDVNKNLRSEIASHLLVSRGLELRIIELEHEMEGVRKLTNDPRARPDSHTRTDDDKQMMIFRDWAMNEFQKKTTGE